MGRGGFSFIVREVQDSLECRCQAPGLSDVISRDRSFATILCCAVISYALPFSALNTTELLLMMWSIVVMCANVAKFLVESELLGIAVLLAEKKAAANVEHAGLDTLRSETSHLLSDSLELSFETNHSSAASLSMLIPAWRQE